MRLTENLSEKANRKMAYGNRMITRDRRRHVTLKRQCRDPNTLREQYLENSWRCYMYLATIANYYSLL